MDMTRTHLFVLLIINFLAGWWLSFAFNHFFQLGGCK